jgi:hypothetical protein
VWTYFAAQCWAIWTTRNKFTIEGKFPRRPADCIFKISLSLQLWRPLQRAKDEGTLDELIAMTKAFSLLHTRPQHHRPVPSLLFWTALEFTVFIIAPQLPSSLRAVLVLY